MRLFLHLFFLLLPFVTFWLYVRFAVSYRERFGHGFYTTHWYWVALVGLLLFGGSFFLLTGDRIYSVDEQYIPPHMEGGKMVPGHFEPKSLPEMPPGNSPATP